MDGRQQVDVAEFSYDALGRRIEKKDNINSANTLRYYYNNSWQVLEMRDTDGTSKGWFAYGNYIDEVLMYGGSAWPGVLHYLHDHL